MDRLASQPTGNHFPQHHQRRVEPMEIRIGTSRLERNCLLTRYRTEYSDGEVEYSEWKDMHVCVTFDNQCAKCGKMYRPEGESK